MIAWATLQWGKSKAKGGQPNGQAPSLRINKFPGICHGGFRQCLWAIDRATPRPAAVGEGQSSQLGEEGGAIVHLARGDQKLKTKKGLKRERNQHNSTFALTDFFRDPK